VAAALAIRQRDLSLLLVSAMTYTTFGVCQFVAVFWHWSQFSRRDHWLWAYLMVLVVIVLTGAYGWWAARRAAGDPVLATEGGEPATATARGRPDRPG
jgi:heme A synthase